MSRRNSNRKLYWCAFLLPFFIAVLICIRNGVYPFGENCILHIDMYHQYEPFFTEFMDKLKNGRSLMYSFRIGLGADFVSLFAYYLASPFNWMLLFVPSDYVIEFMTLLVLLKIGLCGFTFEVYLRNHFERQDLGGVVFAAFYALSGYMAAYSWNIMWLDCIVLAPLVVLGLERLIKEGKCRLYCVSLAIAVLSNFYIAFMLCVFLALWFLMVMSEEVRGKMARVKCFGRFALYSLLSGGMGAVLILPESVILSYSGSSGFSVPETMEWYFDFVSMLARHCVNVETYTGREHWPNLYCGSAIFLFLALYFCQRSISWKKKAKRMAWILFFWFSFANNFLDFFWHGLHFPDSLPGRQTYLYIFLLLTLAYEGYIRQEKFVWKDIAAGIAGTVVFLMASAYVADTGMVTGSSLALTGMVAIGFGLLLFLERTGFERGRNLARYLLLFLAVTELFVNFGTTGLSVTSRKSYTKNWKSVKELLAKVKEEESESFYRVEEMERLTKNDAAIYGYSSSTTFSSLMNISVSRFYRSLGMEGGKNFYSYSGATPLTSAMLSVKYLISKNPYEESPLKKMVAEDGENYIYENLYTLPVGFMLDVDFESRWNAKRGEPIQNLNRMAKALGADEDLLIPFEGSIDAGEDKTTIKVLNDCYLYGVYTDTSVTNITVKNQKRIRKFNKCDHGYILDLGWCEAGDVVELKNSSGVSGFHVKGYVLNMNALKQAYGKMSAQTFRPDYFSDTKIEGKIDVKEAGNLIFSIPQERGWEIFVDGKKTDCGAFMNSFIKIPLIRGEHHIMLRYKTPGLLPGLGISLASLFCFLWISFRKKE